MKKFSLILVVLAALGLMIGACGDDGGSPCDEVADEMMAAMDEGCAGKDADCWYCDCYNKGQIVDMDMTDPMNIVYSCADPDPVDPVDPVACEGAVKTQAEAWLENVDANKQTIIDGQTAACDAMPKE